MITFLKKYKLEVLVFSIITVTYLYNVNPFAGFHDSLGYLYYANQGFIFKTNATAHFLYLNLLHIQYLFTGNILPQAYSHNLLSVFFSFTALMFIYKTLLLFNINKVLTLTSLVIIAFSYTFWSQSMTIEAYPMNNMLFTIYFYFALKDILLGEYKRQMIVSIFFSLALLTHIQNILSLPFLIYYFYKSNLGLKKWISSIIPVLLAFIILYLPYLIHDSVNPSVIFFDREFQVQALAYHPEIVLNGIINGIAYFVYNFPLYFILIFPGIYFIYIKSKAVFICILFLLVPYLIFAVRYDIPDVYPFYLIPYILCSLCFATGLEFIYEKINKGIKTGLIYFLLAFVLLFQPLFYYTISKNAYKIEQFHKYGEPKSYKGGYAYYFWPGRRNAPDPLKSALKIYNSGDKQKICFAQNNWNFVYAIKYLEKSEQHTFTVLTECE